MISQEIKHSSQISKVSYEPFTKEMQITFKRGITYSYSDVPADLYTGIITAQSAGSYFAENIKGKYQYKKIS